MAVLAIGTANAQTDKPTTSLLRWTAEQQAEWYPQIETVFPSGVVKRGDRVQPLSRADRPIDNSFTYTQADRTWTVEEYMKAYNVSGVMVVKDGKVLLERYGLG